MFFWDVPAKSWEERVYLMRTEYARCGNGYSPRGSPNLADQQTTTQTTSSLTTNKMRVFDIDGAEKLGTSFGLAEASDVRLTSPTNAHNLTTITDAHTSDTSDLSLIHI